MAGRVATAIGVYACVAAALLKLAYLSDVIALLGAAALLLAAALFESGYVARREARVSGTTIRPKRHWLVKQLPIERMIRWRARFDSYRDATRSGLLSLSAMAGAYQAFIGSTGSPPRVELIYLLVAASGISSILLIVAERCSAALAAET